MGQLVAKSLAAATFIVLARLIPKYAIGHFVSALLVASFIAAIIDFGTSATTLRLAATEGFYASRAFMHRRVIGCRLLAFFGVLLALMLPQHTYGTLVGISITLAALLTLNGFNEGQLLGVGRGGIAAGGNALSNGVTFVAAIAFGILAAAHATAAMIIASYAIGALCANCLYALAIRRNYKISKVPSSYSEAGYEQDILQRRLVGWLNVTSFLYYRADLLTLTVLDPASTVAIYAAAYRIFEIIPILVRLAGLARQPAVAREIANGSADLAGRRTYLGLFVMALALAQLLLAVGSIAVTLLFGSRYHSAMTVLEYLIPGGLGAALNIAAFTCVASSDVLEDRRIHIVIVNIMSIPCLIGAIIAGRAFLGLPGVAFAQSAIEILVGVILTALVSAEFDIWHRRGHWRMLGATMWFIISLISIVLPIHFEVLRLIIPAVFAVAAIRWSKPIFRIATSW